MTAAGIMSANEHNQQHLKPLHEFVHVGTAVGVDFAVSCVTSTNSCQRFVHVGYCRVFFHYNPSLTGYVRPIWSVKCQNCKYLHKKIKDIALISQPITLSRDMCHLSEPYRTVGYCLESQLWTV